MVTKEMFEEMKILRKKIARLEGVMASHINSSICDVLLEEYYKQIELAWEMVTLSFEGVEYDISKTIELYYYWNLKIEEISEYFFRGAKTPVSVRKIIKEFMGVLEIKNEHGLPLLYRVHSKDDILLVKNT